MKGKELVDLCVCVCVHTHTRAHNYALCKCVLRGSGTPNKARLRTQLLMLEPLSYSHLETTVDCINVSLQLTHIQIHIRKCM